MRTVFNTPAARNAAGSQQKSRQKPASACGHCLHPLDEAGQKRVEAYTWLAYQLAWQFARRNARDVPADELISEALYGLTYASGLFREELGVPFGAYARIVIRHRLIQSIITWRRNRRAGPFPTIPTETGSIELEAEDRPTQDLCAGAAAKEMCDRVREILPARLYDVLRLYHGEGYTLEEVGSRLGITRQRVRQLVNVARNQVRLCFPEWSRY